MTLIIALNAVLCFGVIVAVATPLLWAILTQHRDHPVALAYRTHVPELVRPWPEPAQARHRRPEVAMA
jgi:hypothetical protein